MFRDEFLGLSVFAYNRREANAEPARQGYAQLKQLLSETLGDPVEEWGPATEPACVWLPGPLVLDMYCFQRDSSGIMVGPRHAERTAANDAAALSRQTTRPGNPPA